MLVINNSPNPITQNAVCALGNFDGIHRGHLAIIDYARNIAGQNRETGIITFDPSPITVLKKHNALFLTTKQEKENLLNTINIDFLYYFQFDTKFSEQSAEEFVDLLSKVIKPYAIVVGENFHFGKKRKGTAITLRNLAHGRFIVHILPALKDHNGVISSTRIRELLLLGNIPGANRILGREYSLTGRVIKGKGKGSKLGFPTINLMVAGEKLLPLDGVYEVRLEINGIIYKGAMFLSHSQIEVHIIGFSGILYDRDISVAFVRRLRSIKEFTDDEHLKKAIAEDIAKITKTD